MATSPTKKRGPRPKARSKGGTSSKGSTTSKPLSRSGSSNRGKHKQSNATSNRPSQYRKFDPLTVPIRDGTIKSIIKQYQDLKAKGKASRGTWQTLIANANRVAPALDITRDVINNELRRQKAEAKKNASQVSSVEESSSAASSSATTVSSSSSGSSENSSGLQLASQLAPHPGSQRDGLSLLASAAASTQVSAPTTQSQHSADAAAASDQSTISSLSTSSSAEQIEATTTTQLPNRCHFLNCGAPLTLAPTGCNKCGRGLLHLGCYIHATGVLDDPKCYCCLQLNASSSSIQGPSESTANSSLTSHSSSRTSLMGCSCSWPGCKNNEEPDNCSTCNDPVHRTCNWDGERGNGWSHISESRLVCPRCHPDNAPNSNPSVTVSTATQSGAASPDQADESINPTNPTAATKKKNKGGRPKGSTNPAKRAAIRHKKEAVNHVVVEYNRLQELAKAQNEKSKKRIRVEAGTRAKLVATAKTLYNIKDKKFDVPKNTIQNRIKTTRLEVWQPGEKSPVLMIEVVLKAYILTAFLVECPLNVSETIALMNDLIDGTEHEASLIEWKMKRNMYDPDSPLLNRAWWRSFKIRNPDVVAKTGRKYARNRSGHCHYEAFFKMCNQVENGLIKSGNAKKLDEPVHMDLEGNVVEDESQAFGYPVTLDITHPENCFHTDETGATTSGKDDGNKAGEKAVVPAGEIPREQVGIQHHHFTLLPISDFTGRLRFLTVIFTGKKLKEIMTLGIDVFAELDEVNWENNFGPGKRYPGLSLFDPEGNEIPVMFAVSKKSSMTGDILHKTFKKMDELGLTFHGEDKDGVYREPLMLIDGHISRLNSGFLVYTNEPDTNWMVILGAPYGTDIWQYHDDTRQNGTFKSAFYDAKSKFVLKKRVNGLPGEVRTDEIVIVLQPAVMESFMRKDIGRRTNAHRGWNPFNRNTLDHPQILASAPEDVQQERKRVLASRGINTASNTYVPPSQLNLLETGSGQLAGGASAIQELARVTETLNFNGNTASDIMTLAQNNKNKSNGRREHMAGDAAAGNKVPLEELKRRYKEGTLTTGKVFGKGDGQLGPVVRDEVLRRKAATEAKETTTRRNKRKTLAQDIAAHRKVLVMMKKKGFKWTIPLLKKAIKPLKTKEDGAMPGTRAPLLTLWGKLKNRPLPQLSPSDSDDEDELEDGSGSGDEEEEEEGSESEEEGSESEDEESDVEGLIFGDSESEDDNDDEESEEEDSQSEEEDG